MLPLAVVLTLVHALDESQVKVTERRGVLTRPPPTTGQLGSIDRDALSRMEAADLARLEAARPARRRSRLGLHGQQTPAPAQRTDVAFRFFSESTKR